MKHRKRKKKIEEQSNKEQNAAGQSGEQKTGLRKKKTKADLA